MSHSEPTRQPLTADSFQPIYGLDDRPALPRTLVLGTQHVLTMFGATVSVPLLLGPRLFRLLCLQAVPPGHGRNHHHRSEQDVS